MNTTLLFVIITFSALLHLLLIRFAPALKLVDTPNERSMHKKPVPRGAGIAIVLSVVLAQIFFNLSFVLNHLLLFTTISLVFFIGFVDDRHNVSPRIKLLFIFAASLLVYFEGVQIDTLGTYFGYGIDLPEWLMIPFLFFAIAGFTNALNLIDGLDGLAASVSLIILTTFLTIGMIHNDPLIITLSASFIAATGVFWFFNWNPAKIFMGDSGSLTLGFVIAILSVLSIQYATPTSILMIIAIPLLDTFIVMTRRYQRKQSLFRADKNHIHHFMVKMKGEVRFSVILIASIQAIFSIIGFQLRESNDLLTLILFSLLFFTFLNLFDQRIRRRKKKKHEKHKELQKKEPSSMSEPLPETSYHSPILVTTEAA